MKKKKELLRQFTNMKILRKTETDEGSLKLPFKSPHYGHENLRHRIETTGFKTIANNFHAKVEQNVDKLKKKLSKYSDI